MWLRLSLFVRNAPMFLELFTAIALEAMYDNLRLPLLQHGMMLTRRDFLATPGWPMVTPFHAVELARMGARVVGWQAMFQVPHGQPGRGPIDRN
jgi:hypothetical protein